MSGDSSASKGREVLGVGMDSEKKVKKVKEDLRAPNLDIRDALNQLSRGINLPDLDNDQNAPESEGLTPAVPNETRALEALGESFLADYNVETIKDLYQKFDRQGDPFDLIERANNA